VTDRLLQTTAVEIEGGGGGDADLLLVAGPGRLLTRKLDRPALVIGRAPECDVVIDHAALSRRHAVLHTRPLAIEDLGSTNGVRWREGRLRGGPPALLAAGDTFHVGPFSFMVVVSRGGEQPATDGAERLFVDDPTPTGVSDLVRVIAASGASVIVLGETGVGKEVLAETLHELSMRPGPLRRINCAALSASLLESELFGHEKGAFTGAVAARAGLLEDAAGGTVFLDEIGELPLSIQSKLLRAVEAREIVRVGSARPIRIDVRFVSATNRELPAEVAAGRFRRDLYFRLDGVTLRIPPLRERPGAIARLTLGFLDEIGRRLGRRLEAAPELIAALEKHAWPGNVRELRAVAERAVLLAGGDTLTTAHLVLTPPAPAPSRSSSSPSPSSDPATAPPADVEDDLGFLTAAQRDDRARLLAVLDRCVGNQTRAARELGISRTTLVNKLGLYRIRRPRG
jgi:two-component system, NtrC family, response regulator AtoC